MALLALPLLRPGEGPNVPRALEPEEWLGNDVVTWLRGVEPLTAEQLALLTAASPRGAHFLTFTAADLKAFKIECVGQQESILAAIQALRNLNTHAKCPAFQWLGNKLLQAGRRIDEQPLGAAADMMAALSSAIVELDCAPPPDVARYVALRQALIDHAVNFNADLPSLTSTAATAVRVRDLIRMMLPTLTELNKLFPSRKEECKLHVVTVQCTPGSDLKMSVDLNEQNYLYVSHIVPKGPADLCGMLRVGDQVMRIDGQAVVGWRPKKVFALLHQVQQSAVRFSIKISAREFDARIAALMEQARLIRQAVATPRSQRRSDAVVATEAHGVSTVPAAGPAIASASALTTTSASAAAPVPAPAPAPAPASASTAAPATATAAAPRTSFSASAAAGSAVPSSAQAAASTAVTASSTAPPAAAAAAPTAAAASAAHKAQSSSPHKLAQSGVAAALAAAAASLPPIAPVHPVPGTDISDPTDATSGAAQGESKAASAKPVPRIPTSLSAAKLAIPAGRDSVGMAKTASSEGLLCSPSDSADQPLQVLQPRLNQHCSAGRTYEIKWASKAVVAAKCLRLSLQSPHSGPLVRIASQVLNIGSFSWTVPMFLEPGPGYQLIVETAGGSAAHQVFASDPFVVTPTTNELPRIVYLSRTKAGHFGFSTEGSFVAQVFSEAEGKVKVGDQLLSVDGMPIQTLSHVAILNVLRNVSDTVTLVVVSHMSGYKRLVEEADLLSLKYKEKLCLRKVDLPPLDTLDDLGLALQVHNKTPSIHSMVAGALPSDARQQLGAGTGLVQINGQPLHGATVGEILMFVEANLKKPMDLLVTSNVSALQAYNEELAQLEVACVLGEDVCTDLRQRIATQRTKTNDMSVMERASSRKALELGNGRSASVSVPRRPSLPPDINTPCPAITNPDCDGWLSKLGGSGLTPKNWRTRWFVLKRGTLLYYKTPQDTEALGCIRLFGYRIMPAPPNKRMQTKWGFKVCKPDSRSYYICAEDEASMKKWMNCMSLAAICYVPSEEERLQQEEFERERDYLLKHGVACRRTSGTNSDGARSHQSGAAGVEEEAAPPIASRGSLEPRLPPAVTALISSNSRTRMGSAGQDRLSRLRGIRSETMC